ncbi:mitochondrial amidoxime-reducing component 1-like [Cynocephalus volans]|uniref:mitochondrial amidoxime-reducing component 1-like n=1 Tax=Cynocephalus volans TaxID=110931 RepID=UPI002FC791EA
MLTRSPLSSREAAAYCLISDFKIALGHRALQPRRRRQRAKTVRSLCHHLRSPACGATAGRRARSRLGSAASRLCSPGRRPRLPRARGGLRAPAPTPPPAPSAGSLALARLGLRGRPRPGSLGVAALGEVAWRRARPGRRRRLQQVGTVARLWIYPVKSCKGVPVSAAECTPLGLLSGHLRDRFWLVINKEGNVVTACQEPCLVLISLTCDGDALTLSAAYTKDLQLPIKTPTTNAVRKCRYNDKCDAHSDASPFSILSEASLADLNSRLEKKVEAANFRPNILISGCGVYAEDSWDELLIGDVGLKRVMACSRCIFTTVDLDTGITSRKEPLETLKSYLQCGPCEQKLYGKSPLFGQYFVLESPETVKVGDPMYLLGQ